MQELFTPDFGLMVWTVITFVLLLAILGRFGWGPLIASIEARERRLREDREAAESARADAQRIQREMESKLAAIDVRTQELLAQATQEAQELHRKHTTAAQEEAKRLMDKTRSELEEEKRRLIGQLRAEVAGLAVQAAEKLVAKSVDEGVRKTTLDQFFKEMEKAATKN